MKFKLDVDDAIVTVEQCGKNSWEWFFKYLDGSYNEDRDFGYHPTERKSKETAFDTYIANIGLFNETKRAKWIKVD